MTKRVKVKRVVRRTRRSPEERKKIQSARERFQREKPSLKMLIAEGDVDEAMPWGKFLALHEVFRALKRIRRQRGLSLAEVAESSGIDKAALSRLEKGSQNNPTINTIYRYARAVGAEIRISVKMSERSEA